MRIGLLKEHNEKENRVALVPDDIKKLISSDYEVCFEQEAGQKALFSDQEYKKAGALVCSRAEIFKKSDIIISISSPKKGEIKKLQKFSSIICLTSEKSTCHILQKNELTLLSLDLMPRQSNLQNIDVLSSQDMLGGYASVCRVSSELKKIIPLNITAAGNLAPATFLVIGIGVFGLSALSAAKKIGAATYAYDINPQTEEIAKSVGAKFISLDTKEKIETFLPKTDVLICSAFSHNQPAKKIIDENLLTLLPQGSIVIDAAIKEGGNVIGSKKNEITQKHNSKIFGYENWASQIPYSASILLSKNISNFLQLYFKNGRPDFSNETIHSICLCRNGKTS